jgi:hypothetical protein
MTPRAMGRTSPCGRPEANTRLDHAKKYLEVADLVAAEGDEIPASASVAASLTVLADIAAAADAACCAALGLRSRGQDHQQASTSLPKCNPEVEPRRKPLRGYWTSRTPRNMASSTSPRVTRNPRCAQAPR